jgi:hypothetical protein
MPSVHFHRLWKTVNEAIHRDTIQCGTLHFPGNQNAVHAEQLPMEDKAILQTHIIFF